jgi:hypothetical protein
MKRNTAVQVLQDCYVNGNPFTERKAGKLWKHYHQKVEQLEPRICCPLGSLPLTEAECQAAQTHIAALTPKVNFGPQVIKLNPANLLLRQFQVVTERCDDYAAIIQDEQARINHCLGIGLNFKGQLVSRRISPKLMVLDLPHFEYTLHGVNPQQGFIVEEWPRYISVFNADATKTVLWGGYHRTYALFCQLGGDGLGGAPLFTTVTGSSVVNDFIAKPSREREAVLGDRPALLRDFLDGDLFMEVNLRKRRAQAFARIPNPLRMEWGIKYVTDDS